MWWMARLAVEGGVGIGGYAALAATDVTWFDGPLGWIIGGLTGPVVVRSRVITLGKESDEKPVGLAYFYDAIRTFFEGRIDRIGAARDAFWLEGDVIPTLLKRKEPSRTFGREVLAYLRGRKMSSDSRARIQAKVLTTLEDQASSEQAKVEVLVQIVHEMGAFELLVGPNTPGGTALAASGSDQQARPTEDPTKDG